VFACGKGEYTGLGGRADVLIPLLLDAFDGVPVKQVSPIQASYIFSSRPLSILI
jgi:hypothetical protein